MAPQKTTQSSLIERVLDGLDYFESYRLEELKTDDIYYITAFISYIKQLERTIISYNNK